MTEIAGHFRLGFLQKLSTSGIGWPTRTRTADLWNIADGLLAAPCSIGCTRASPAAIRVVRTDAYQHRRRPDGGAETPDGATRRESEYSIPRPTPSGSA